MANRGCARVPLTHPLKGFLLAGAVVLGLASAAIAGDVQTAGKLAVPLNAPLAAISTDPIFQRTLDQDFRGQHRGPDSSSGTPIVTVTVTVNEKLLKPGVMLGDLGPGDPWVLANLLRQAGAEPPPLGDTGNKPLNPYSESVRRQVMQPEDPMQRFRDYQAMKNAYDRPEGPRFGPNGRAKDQEIYDRAIVARASASNSNDQMTAVIVAHPGDDVSMAKELLAEAIANQILH